MTRVLLVACILSQVILIANPGYFNVDEVQVLERVRGIPFLHIVFSSFAESGPFYRPIGYWAFHTTQWLSAENPQIAHMISAVTHLLSAGSLFLLSRRFTGPQAAAWIALAFCLSPLGVHSVGWIAAVYERLSVLILLLGLHAFLAFVDGRSKSLALGAVVACQVFGLLTKETCVVFPAAVLLLAIATRAFARSLLLILALGALVVIYCVLRLQQPNWVEATGYEFAFGVNLLQNAVSYGAFAFSSDLRVDAVEMSGAWYLSSGVLLGVACAVAVFRVLGFQRAGLLALLGLLPLLPVLPLLAVRGNYLYGSAVAFAVALGWAWTRSAQAGRLWMWMTRGLVILSVLHCGAVQARYYLDGTQARKTLESARKLVANTIDDPAVFHIMPEPKTRFWVAQRLLTRLRTLNERSVVFTTEGYPEKPGADARRIRMLPDGSLIE